MMHPSLEENFEPKESVRTVVPWFCMEELSHVHSAIFDSDLELLKQGYFHTLMWKARRTFMPPGIEATHNLCEVLLQDGKYQKSLDKLMLPQLRLMYATTIMRFLNLVLNDRDGKAEKKTLFHLADAVGIPRWIVEIRHDSAHGSVLPDIEVLRSAARFSMDWLNRRYWEEVLKTSDLINNVDDIIISDDEDMINKIFHCWETIVIIRIVGLSSKKIRQSELWENVNEVGASLKSKHLRPTTEMTSIDEAVSVLLMKIKEMLRNKRNKFVKSVFVRRMLSGESILPSENILSVFKAKSSNKEFPEALSRAWSEIMEETWESGSIAILIMQLLRIVKDTNESDLRREYALLWMRQILLSLIKMKECKKVHEGLLSRHKYRDQYSPEQLQRAIKNAVVAQRPELRHAYNWTVLPLPLCVVNTELIEKCLSSPLPANVNLIFPSMMALLDPPLPIGMQEALRVCVVKFGNPDSVSKKGFSEKRPPSDTMFTLSDVLLLNRKSNGERETNLRNVSETSLDVCPSVESSPVQSMWERSSDMFKWSGSSLGVLPWQCDHAIKVWRDLEITDEWGKGKSYTKAK